MAIIRIALRESIQKFKKLCPKGQERTNTDWKIGDVCLKEEETAKDLCE